MEVTNKDQSNERTIIQILKSKSPLFKNIKFKQGGTVSIFDFKGFKNDSVKLELDVKVRDYASDRFPTLFISTDKIKYMGKYPDRNYYVAFYFKPDFTLRVYHLNNLELEEHDLEFTHKRTGKRMEQKVFKIPAKYHCFEAILVQVDKGI